MHPQIRPEEDHASSTDLFAHMKPEKRSQRNFGSVAVKEPYYIRRYHRDHDIIPIQSGKLAY